MKIGCSSWSYREPIQAKKMDLIGFVKEARKVGFRAVELLHSHFRETSHAYLDELSAVAQSQGLLISAVSPSNDFALPDSTERAREVAKVRSWIQIAADMKVRNLRVFTGDDKAGVSYEDQKRWVMESLRACVALAEASEVRLVVENHSSVMRTAEELVALIEEIGSEAVRANPDPTNFSEKIWAGLDPEVPGALSPKEAKAENERICKDLRKVMPYAAHARLKVGFFTQKGKLTRANYEKVLETFGKAGYEGVISLELIGPQTAEPSAALGKCLKQLQDLV